MMNGPVQIERLTSPLKIFWVVSVRALAGIIITGIKGTPLRSKS
jgi:hypothetical protein